MAIIINALFTSVMLFLAYVDVRSYQKKEHKDLKSPILSLGILGTFLGIFLGLMGFDTSDIQESVPKLLEGLKIAFFTSIAGMGVAISLYIYQKFNPIKSGDDVGELEYIKEKIDKLDQLDKLDSLSYLEMLKALYHQKSIDTASQESLAELKSINKNIERYNASMQDLLLASFEQILVSLKRATEEIARGASVEIVNALEKVIKDFNQNLNDQFGDNFKELNAGVHNLITWQNNYKSSIESSEKSLKLCVDSISSSKDTLELIASKNDEITGVYRDLSFIINTYANQIKTLNALLSEFSTLGEQSRESLQNIEAGFSLSKERFGELMQNFFYSIAESKDRISKGIEEIYTKSYESNEDVSQKLTLLFENSCKNLDFISQETSESITSMMQNLNQNGEKLLEEFIKHGTQSSNAGVALIDNLSQEAKDRILRAFDTLNSNTVEINSKLLGLAEGFAKESAKNIEESFTLCSEHIQDGNLKLIESGEKLEGTIEGINSKASRALEHIQEHTISSVEEVQKNILSNSQTFFDSIFRDTTRHIEALNATVSNLQEYALSSINDVKTHNLESANSFFETIRESTKKHITDVSLSAIELNELAKLTMNEVKEHSIENSKGFYEAVSDATHRHLSQISRTSAEVADTTKQHIAGITEVATNSVNSTKQNIEELKNYTIESATTFYDNIREGVKNHLEQTSAYQKESLDNNINTLRESLASGHQELLQNIAYANKSATDEQSSMIDSFLNALDSTIKRSIGGASEFIQNTLEASKAAFEESSNTIKTVAQSIESLSKDSIEQGNISQRAIEKSFAMSAKAHKELSEKNSKLLESVDNDLRALMETQKASFAQSIEHYGTFAKETQKELSELLSSIDSFNTEFTLNSSESLKNMTNEIKESAESLHGSIDTLVKRTVQNIGDLLRQATSDYLSTLETTTNEGKDIPLKIAENIKNSFLSVQKELAEYSKSTNSSIYNTKNILEELAKQTNTNLSSQIEENRALNEELQKSLRILDNSMHAVITGFKNDYDWLLRRIRELMGTERL